MTNHPPFSVEEFLSFVRSKPASEKYDAGDGAMCALAQFGYPGLLGHRCDKHGIPHAVYSAAVYTESEAEETFGALATRLEAVMGEKVL